MTSVTFPTALGGDGSTVSDDADPTTGLRNAGYKTRFVPALQQTVNMTQTTVNKAAAAAASEAITVTKAAEARASELAAAGYANEAMLLSLGVETLRPSIKPSLLLDFARAQVVPPSVTFTRASTATRVGPSGLIETVGINVPRLDYDPITRACLGLLVEEQRSNLLFYSEEFDNAYYTRFGVTPSVNSAVGPDGLTTAEKIVVDNGVTAGDGSGISRITLSLTDNTVYAISVFAKAAEISSFRLGGRTKVNSNDRIFGEFNLLSGTAVAGSSGLSASIQPYPNGWFRCVATFNASSGAAGPRATILPPSGFVGNGASGFFAWGFQLEAGSFPTSYIPTSAASVTRGADVASVNTLSPWYRADEGTIFIEATAGYFSNNRTLLDFDGSLSDAAKLFIKNNGAISAGRFFTGEINSPANIVPALPSTARLKTAVASLAGLSMTLATNGVVNGTSTESSNQIFPLPGSAVKLNIGKLNAASDFLNGHIRQISYFPQRLISAQLQALTTL